MIEICLLIIALALLPVAVWGCCVASDWGWLASVLRRVSFGFDSVDSGRGIRSIWAGRSLDWFSSLWCCGLACALFFFVKLLKYVATAADSTAKENRYREYKENMDEKKEFRERYERERK